MKQWTVMLIPHDRSNRRTLTVNAVHIWLPVIALALLVFASAFLFQRQRALARQNHAMQEAVRKAEEGEAALNASQTARLESLAEEIARLRQEKTELEAAKESDRAAYRESIGAVTARLNEVLEIESRIRSVTGLAPRAESTPADMNLGSGKGGPPEGFGATVLARHDERLRPPVLIYGMSRPSADLIIQEMSLRTGSLSELIDDIEVQRDRIERTPSIWPVARRAGQITSDFGYRKDPFTRRIRHHDGVDIAAPTGTTVRASAKGTVIEATRDRYYGYLVKIDHGNDLHTWYAHLSKCLVEKGDFVMRSDPIGRVGTTGRSTGPHLHYEVRENGQPINAGQYLGG
ncbi:MAG: peptidoglycan DD-metalloendopeptidase family protein [Candidatus Hydrogenedentota bacterium]